MKTKMTPQAIKLLFLKRFPQTSDQTLKAWNAADEYIIHYIQESITLNEASKVLIINDQFGALTCSLSAHNSYSWVDSFLSKMAVQLNLESNNVKQNIKPTFKHINQTTNNIPKDIQFDLVIIRIPKHNSLLEFQLKSILPHIKPQTKIIASGMTKDIHNSNIKMFEKIIGTTTTSLAKKKARLIFSKPEKKSSNYIDSLLDQEAVSYQLKTKYNNLELKIIGLPGVFSRDNLDIGTRVLLDYMPKTKTNETLIDLGCGTGVLGTLAAKQNSQLDVIFTDESYLAVESAKKTYYENIDCVSVTNPQFITTNVLDELKNNIANHILCNPPFHQQNVQTLSIANKMFKESAQKLKSHGELRVVANRHLKYKPMLLSYFKEVSVISNDSKFVVWLAKNPKHSD